VNCHACGASLAPPARYCHKCGALVGGQSVGGWRAGLPWGVAGLALGALVAVVALRLGGGGGAAGRDEAPGSGSATAARMPAPDISQMSPEERARRLFDRVLALSERGQADSVAFFLPMALGAYAQLPALDLDARYDIGVLHLAAGDPGGALAQADTILHAVRTHLYGFILRARAFELRGNVREARRAYADFLRHEPAERARRRAEYAEHEGVLAAFHERAVRQAGARSGA
jgi:hypothetical protein